ncbi:hypothetical protein MKK50_14490 [Methylobacterium sp. J-043]|nr:hypothetical protein [Methylobacterium sp. J-043]
MWLPLGLALLFVLLVFAGFHLTRATTLTIAVAPNGGTEPTLLRAYADELARRKLAVRLKVVAFGGVRESAEALRTGNADLAVVRPDVSMPGNGLTLAVLRELAAFVVAPGASGVKAVPDLAGKRLGMLASRTADRTLLRDLLAHHGLQLVFNAPAAGMGGKTVALVPVEESGLSVVR